MEPGFKRFILLPERGLRALPSNARAFQVLTSMSGARSTATPLSLSIPEIPQTLTVIDSIQENGPKLVEAHESAALAVQAAPIGFRLAPIREYHIAVAPAFAPVPVPGASTAPSIQIAITVAATGAPVPSADVTAFTDFANNIGATGTTDATGVVQLALGNSPVTVERLYISPPRSGFWGAFQTLVQIRSGDQFAIEKIDFSVDDVVRKTYGSSALTDGSGIKVGVLDTGIDLKHPDLSVASGRNTARGEPANDYDDNGVGHGTHVAGIIAAKGTAPNGVRGLAPGVTLASYRVFAANQRMTTNYEILKAMIFAVNDRCDLLNLSLGGTPPDDVMRDAIQDAGDQGTLVIVAAGNDTRKPVSFPAAYPPALAISAFGTKGTFPSGAYEECFIEPNPPSTVDPNNFMATFTNYGLEIFFAAPGVGIVSTIASGGYGSMSGTSMAAPVVTGIAARLLSMKPAIQSMNRDTFRTRAITNLLSGSAVDPGFPFNYQGFGRPG